MSGGYEKEDMARYDEIVLIDPRWRLIRLRKGDKWALARQYKMFERIYPLSDFEYDDVRAVGDGVVAAYKGNLCALMGIAGQLISDEMYEDCKRIWSFESYPVFAVKKDGRWGMIDQDGRMLFPCCCEQIRDDYYSDWRDGCCEAIPCNPLVKIGGLWGIARSIPALYDLADWREAESEADADDAEEPEEEAEENICGNDSPDTDEIMEDLLIFAPQWEDCRYTRAGHAREGYGEMEALFISVCRDGKWGVADTAGRIVTPCKWDEIDAQGNARMGGHWGFVNLITGEETAPQWAENQRLSPYEVVRMRGYPQRPNDRYDDWVKTMRVYRGPGL